MALGQICFVNSADRDGGGLEGLSVGVIRANLTHVQTRSGHGLGEIENGLTIGFKNHRRRFQATPG
jgi:hypothetical protein